MKNLKLLFQLILFYATFIPSFALPTETSSAPDPRALKLLSVEDITESDTLDVRSDNIVSEVLDLKPRATGPPQTFHLIGFTSDQGIRVRRAIGEAAWMGEMGNQHLARINSFNDLSPEFRTYFGNSFDTTNMDVIRNAVNNLATITTNGMLGFVYYSPVPNAQRPTAIASVRGRTMTIYPPFFGDDVPALGQLAFQAGDNTDTGVLSYNRNQAMTIAHEIMHYTDNNFGPSNTHITDMTWALANNPGSPTYNGAFPTSSTPILYTAQQASQLASFNQFAAMRNAANYQYFLFAVYVGLWLNRLVVPLIRRPDTPSPKARRDIIFEALPTMAPLATISFKA